MFVYAGIAIDEERASQLHAEAVTSFRIPGRELKGANLLKYNRGRKAVSWILAESSKYSHVMVANKKYALACKFFEYIFEPVLAEHNSLFYAIDFHKFVATLLHMCATAGDPHVNKSLKNFVEMMKNMDPDQLEVVLSPLGYFDQSNPIGMVFAFALCHQKRIKDEIRTVRESDSLAGWSLELSMTALHWLLASWGEEFDVLDVYCDKSKPIQEASEFFDVFIGRDDKSYVRFGSQPSPPIIYNLSGPISLLDSRESHAVQIADVVSSSLAYAYKNPEDEISKEWIGLMKDVPNNQIIPELTDMDLTLDRAFVNSMVLVELVERSVKGHDLFDNMNDFVLAARSLYPHYLGGVTPTVS